MKKTIAVWFSCGGASAVAAKLTLEKYGKDNNVIVLNNPILEEHPDNRRFLRDVEKWLDIEIIEVKNFKFPNASIIEVFEKRRYMSGIAGAPCTSLLKKEARFQFESQNHIDFNVLGFTVDEWKRQKRFNEKEDTPSIPILIEALLTKEDCFNILQSEGIKLPEIYSLGFPNANCIGCVKSASPTYWNLVRETFPDIFEQRVVQSREIGARLVKVKGKRKFLDELLVTDKGGKIKSWDCGIFCDIKNEAQ